MPAYLNTDAANSKPKFSYERQTRDTIQIATANSTAAFTNTIQLSGTGSGVIVGQYAYAANLSSNGIGGVFASNNTCLLYTSPSPRDS